MPLGLAAGLVGAAAKGIFGLFQNAKANEIDPVYKPYETSQYAKDKLGIAGQYLNGRMPGAADIEKNIYGSQANYLKNAERVATDSSQLLALGGLSQEQTNQSFNQLGLEESQYKQGMLQNYNQALDTMTNEGDKEFQDMWNKYQMDMDRKAETRNAGWANIFGGFNDAASGVAMYDQQKQQQSNFEKYLSMLK